MTYSQAQHELAALTADYYAGHMTYATYQARYNAVRATVGEPDRNVATDSEGHLTR